MTRSDLIKAVVARKPHGVAAADVDALVRATIEVVTEELARGGEVSIKGFGRFEVRERKERIGRNPRTGLDLTLPAGKRVKFVPGKGLKEAIQ